MKDNFKNQFTSGIMKLGEEINKFHSEEDLWKVTGDVSNSSGNLALHLVGNLNHFIGAQLGHTGYQRDRDKEFSLKNVPYAEILFMLNKTNEMLVKVFGQMKEEDLQENYPLDTFGGIKTTEEVLFILLVHFQYHLGQVNYLRRIVSPMPM